MRKTRLVRPTFTKDSLYHVYNRGVAKNELFRNASDYAHLLTTFSYYREFKPETKLSLLTREELRPILARPPKRPVVDILSYCLMPNHFHFLLRQREEQGVSEYLRRVQNSYSRYFNLKYDRIGTMFQGRYQAVSVNTDEQAIHVSRYIHLNPVVAGLAKKPEDYPWSSYRIFLRGDETRLCQPGLIHQLAGSGAHYRSFVEDYIDYAQSLHDLKKLLLD